MSVMHKIKVSLLDKEADNFDPNALKKYIEEEVSSFTDNYGENWGIETEEVFFAEDTDNHTIEFRAEDFLPSLVEELSDDHPGLFFELSYCAPGDFSGIVEYVGGEQWDDQHTTDTEEGRALSEWHRAQLEGEE